MATIDQLLAGEIDITSCTQDELHDLLREVRSNRLRSTEKKPRKTAAKKAKPATPEVDLSTLSKAQVEQLLEILSKK